MADNRTKRMGSGKGLPRFTYSDLRGRQSVRATFKLSERSIDTISVLATHLGIKQKSLFDHLIDDMRALDLIAQDLEHETFQNLDRVQKTYVLSRKTLSSLEEASKRHDAPRDALVEYSIQRLLPLIEEERERHLRRKQVLSRIAEHLGQGEEILKESRELLGEDDPLSAQFETAIKAMRNAHNSMTSFVEKGEMIEDF